MNSSMEDFDKVANFDYLGNVLELKKASAEMGKPAPDEKSHSDLEPDGNTSAAAEDKTIDKIPSTAASKTEELKPECQLSAFDCEDLVRHLIRMCRQGGFFPNSVELEISGDRKYRCSSIYEISRVVESGSTGISRIALEARTATDIQLARLNKSAEGLTGQLNIPFPIVWKKEFVR